MANEKMLKNTQATLIAVGAGAATLATAVISYKGKRTYHKKIQAKSEPCPTCGVIIDKTGDKCDYCNSPNQTCAYCGHLFHSNARFCPLCGKESETGGTVIVNGMSYRGPIREPFPSDRVSHTYCCCGTPFAENAKYCQLCGKKRANIGTFYIVERRI